MIKLNFVILGIYGALAMLSVAAEKFESSLNDLYSHLQKKEVLNAEELMGLEEDIIDQSKEFQTDLGMVEKGFAAVKLYESEYGPLFMNDKVNGMFMRSRYEGIELERVIFALQQGLLDYAYEPKSVGKNSEVFAFKFETADYFPGVCEQEVAKETLSVDINATQIIGYGYPLTDDGDAVRKPTGWYLPAGEVAKLSFPKALVNKGFNIRVGAHSWDLAKRPKVGRLDRVSLVYPIDSEQVTIAHPLGGAIYIEVPWEADAGVVTINSRGLAESPFFSTTSARKLTNADWERELAKKTPWVDFESEKFMMQVPYAWAKELKNPETMMAEYDNCLDLYSELVGRPKIRSKHILYMQVDVTFRGKAFFPGYPQSNFNWDPKNPEITSRDHWVIEGAHKAPSVLFHEMGHHSRFSKFTGGTEAVVNFPYVYIHNVGYGTDLDLAFGKSRDNAAISIDVAAADRMISPTFRAGEPCNISNRPGDEVKYQHRGYAIYGDIAKLFGWDVLTSFWAQDQENYIAGQNSDMEKGKDFPKDINKDPTDNRILRLSIKAGVDLRPLAHFWGRHPEDFKELANAMEKNGLKPSAKIYDRLQHYKSVVPMSADEFLVHAKKLFPRVEQEGQIPNETNPLFGHGLYRLWLKKYNDEHGQKSQDALQDIIDLYFPKGRPTAK
ncbi:MAG: M60 family peptidase N-terminal accessory domain-containing protein [Akkermansiaceae bacterium]